MLIKLFIHIKKKNKDFLIYKEIKNSYSKCKLQNFINIKEFSELMLNNKNIMVLYDLIINEEISNLISNYQPDSYNKFSHFIRHILKNLNLSEVTNQILSLFYNINLFKITIFPLIEKLPSFDYEILLYSHKFSVISSMSNNESFYSKIISQQILEYLKDNYVPGGEPNDSLKIESGEKKKIF